MNNQFFFSGTILPWVPKPSIGTKNPVGIPQCWVECDGRQISKGIWSGQKTPDLNKAQRFLRGGTQAKALEVQDDALQQHEHVINDPGHSHAFVDSDYTYGDDEKIHSSIFSNSYDIDEDNHDSETSPSYTGIIINGVKGARISSETRPKNMKVTFIMKVC